ncbi:MAG: ribonuclease J [Peptococcaceae bacterium BICA1-7]|nr:MAG: ribonuclease J [Peptococcaceae bacterium BICA1-7]HBV97813.1 ribonuclease J [Desulfotomaculum sp.]
MNKRNALSVIPLGGIAEIGKNTLVLECNDDIIVIDAGVKFPTEELTGVDLVIPNITYLKKNREKIRGIILTHGHEDHIGGLPFILNEIDVPVYGTPLTVGLAERKVMEWCHTKRKSSLNTISTNETLHLGCFKVDFFRVNHSIPDGVGLAINSPAGLVVHSGDFKIDQTPVDGKVMEFNKLSSYGDRGVLLFICDSTNVERQGYTPSEKAVGKTLMNIFGNVKNRIIVTTFASNVHRLQQIINAASTFGRKVALVGRSMINVVDVASSLGYLNIPEGTLIELDETKKLSPGKVVIITTGSQGEPMAALTRMSQRTHRQVQIKPGDTIVISANPIPGNERLVARTIDNLFQLGAEVIYKVDGMVHVSGHASQEEIKTVINILKPKYIMPFHGEYRHKVKFSKLAVDMDIPDKNVIRAEVGERWVLYKNKIALEGTVPSGDVLVDGLGIGDVGNVVLQDRQALSTEGVIIVILWVDKQTGMLLAGPEIISRGFVYIRDSMELIDDAKMIVTKELAKLNSARFKSHSSVKGIITKSLSSFLFKITGRSPVILPIIQECPTTTQ